MTGANLAGYAGRKFGAMGIEFGATNTWCNGTINRNVAFPGFADSDKGGFGATATQIVTEATWDQVIAGALLQPFGGLAYVHVSESPLVETGGAAALHVGASSIDDTYTSLGVRGATPVKIGDLDLTVNGLAGWQHAFGVLAP
jgi:fibronectin-binding autotransporter adhesin